jgi:predicted DNA-binding transcriptional regulator YafY
LLSRGTDVAEAADILSREFGISRRQVYRYLKDARANGRAVPVAEPLVPATFKIPSGVLRQLRAYSAVSGLTLSAILTRAVKSYLTSATRQRRKHG